MTLPPSKSPRASEDVVNGEPSSPPLGRTPGTIAFLWSRAEASAGCLDSLYIAPAVRAIASAFGDDQETERWPSNATASRAALACAAADVTSRGASHALTRGGAAFSSFSDAAASTSSSPSSSSEPAWASLADLAVALAASVKKWTTRTIERRFCPSEARAIRLLLLAGLPCAEASRALRKIRNSLDAEIAAVTRGDGSWDSRRQDALTACAAIAPRSRLGPAVSDAAVAAPAYLGAASGDGTESALLACQLALHQCLDAALVAVRADTSMTDDTDDVGTTDDDATDDDDNSALAASTAARLELIASDPACEFAWTAAGDAAAALRAVGGHPPADGVVTFPIDRATPCPATAIGELRHDDAPSAVEAVLQAAAAAAGAMRLGNRQRG